MSSVTAQLKQADLFFDLSPTQLELIASISHMKALNAGELLFEENTDGTELYIIAQGRVQIQVNPALIGKEGVEPQTIATLERGQSFGEVALVDQGLRSASARAAEASTLLHVIPRDKLLLLCDSYPELGYKIMRNMAADLALKIRNTDMQMREYLANYPQS